MNDAEKAALLIRFSDWLVMHGIKHPSKADVYRFMEKNR